MILALDIATKTGWAVGDEQPETGTIELRGSVGEKMHRLARELRLLTSIHSPDLIVFEAPILHVKRQGSSSTLRLLVGLCCVAEMVAFEAGIAVSETPTSTWRKHFLGVSRAPKGLTSKWLKQQAQARCRALGWGDLSEDEADACGVWDHAMSLRRPSHAMTTLPLGDRHA